MFVEWTHSLDEGERVAKYEGSPSPWPVGRQRLSQAMVRSTHPTPGGLDDEALHPIGSLDDLGLPRSGRMPARAR